MMLIAMLNMILDVNSLKRVLTYKNIKDKYVK